MQLSNNANKINILCQKINNLSRKTNNILTLDSGFANIVASDFNDIDPNSVEIQLALYSRVSNVVNFSFQFTASTLSGTPDMGSFETTLPIESNFVNVYDANGTVTDSVENNIGSISAVVGSNRILLRLDLQNIITVNGVAMVQYFIR